MKNFSNTYIFVFSTVMVVAVAALLSFVAIMLKPLQEKNIEIAKKQNILKSVEKAADVENAESKNEYIEQEFNTYITKSYVINSKGETIEGVNAFEVDLRLELAKEEDERNLPIFVFSENNKEKYIIPVRGKGLWGPIWGYVALNDDYNTIYGTTFDHEGETPGLGAEINTPIFQKQFKNKKLYKNGEFVSINVVKGGGAGEKDEYTVDGVSGGTITSNGLEDMLKDVIGSYVTYFDQKRN